MKFLFFSFFLAINLRGTFCFCDDAMSFMSHAFSQLELTTFLTCCLFLKVVTRLPLLVYFHGDFILKFSLADGCDKKRCDFYATCETDEMGRAECVCPRACAKVLFPYSIHLASAITGRTSPIRLCFPKNENVIHCVSLISLTIVAYSRRMLKSAVQTASRIATSASWSKQPVAINSLSLWLRKAIAVCSDDTSLNVTRNSNYFIFYFY